MASWDLPDDWGAYYRTCSRCDRQFHLSEGCSCREDDNCDEDGNEWVDEHIKRVSVHVARRDYPFHKIRKGDTYRRVVTRGYWEGGAWGPWETRRKLITKGPGWAQENDEQPRGE